MGHSGFSNLIDVVRSHGYLTPEDLQFGIKLYGVAPTRENMTQRLMPYVINIYNLGSTPGVSPAVIQDWLKLENRPDELQDWSDDDLVDSDPEINREMLIGGFEREVERLQAIEKQVMREVDQPSLQNVLDRASILTEADARRVARSHSESRTTYHKAAKDLWPMLEREQEDGLQEPAGDDAQGDGDATVAEALGRSRPVGLRPIIPKSNPRNRCQLRHKVLLFQRVRSTSSLRARVYKTAFWAWRRPTKLRTPTHQRLGLERQAQPASRVLRLNSPLSRSRQRRSRPLGGRPVIPKSNPRNPQATRHKALFSSILTSMVSRRLRVYKTAI